MEEKLSVLHDGYDEAEQMILEIYETGGAGYHTNLSGRVHPTVRAACYAADIYGMEQTAYYDRAKSALYRLAELQDQDPQSRTFGLWPYYAEQSLAEMIAPDYNWSDFIGKQIAYILKKHNEKLCAPLRECLREMLRKAAACSLKRNVSPDYTNISIMSKITLICAGEILGDESLLLEGKRRFEKMMEYNRFCGSFSEYNSSAYTVLAIEEAARMQLLFDDPACRAMADELHAMGWRCLAQHYHTGLRQLAPPQMRAYLDLDDGSLESFIYIGTGGKIGRLKKETVDLQWGLFPIRCPEKEERLFYEQPPRWLEETFYRKNNLRNKDEDTTIIRDVDSPDLKAFTYMTDAFAMGAFEKTDLWNQRRTSMVVWGKEQSRYLRLRCFNHAYDYCSGMAYTIQRKNRMLTNLGFVTDRGDFHYILDKVKDGVLTTDFLCFRIEVGGDCKGVRLRREGRTIWIEDEEVSIKIAYANAVFGGADMELVLHSDKRCIDLVCFSGDRTVDFKKSGACFGAFSVEVYSAEEKPMRNEGHEQIEQEIIDGVLVTKWHTQDGIFRVQSPGIPTEFKRAIETTVAEVLL